MYTSSKLGGRFVDIRHNARPERFAMSDSAVTDLDQLGFAVYGLQGGGLGRFAGEVLVFHELPDWCPAEGFNPQVGDPVPEEWDMIPANKAATGEMLDEAFPPVTFDELSQRVDDSIRCPCGAYSNDGVNMYGQAVCPDWPGCVTD
jgi:hypothetical protein